MREGDQRKLKYCFGRNYHRHLHGASLRNEAIFESKIIREEFELVYVPFNYSNSIEELGKVCIQEKYTYL